MSCHRYADVEGKRGYKKKTLERSRTPKQYQNKTHYNVVV
jgi:hypothetical protein